MTLGFASSQTYPDQTDTTTKPTTRNRFHARDDQGSLSHKKSCLRQTSVFEDELDEQYSLFQVEMRKSPKEKLLRLFDDGYQWSVPEILRKERSSSSRDIDSKEDGGSLSRNTRNNREQVRQIYDCEWHEVGNHNTSQILPSIYDKLKQIPSQGEVEESILNDLDKSDPNNPLVMIAKAFINSVSATGSPQRSEELHQQARELLRFNFIARNVLRALWIDRRLKEEERIVAIEKLERLFPGHPLTAFGKMALYRLYGLKNMEKAVSEEGSRYSYLTAEEIAQYKQRSLEYEQKAQEIGEEQANKVYSYQGPFKSVIYSLFSTLGPRSQDLKEHEKYLVERLGWFDRAFYYRWAMAYELADHQLCGSYLKKAVDYIPFYPPAQYKWSQFLELKSASLQRQLQELRTQQFNALFQAAERGEMHAQRDLAETYQTGRTSITREPIVPTNSQAAVYWCQRVVENPNQDPKIQGLKTGAQRILDSINKKTPVASSK